MILTCPECATSYFADDSAVGLGRMVRCAGCGASWRAAPAASLVLDRAAPPTPIAAAEPLPDDDELFEPPPSVDHPAEELPRSFRARAEAGRRTREAAVQGAIWAGMGAVFAVLVAAGLVFRSEVVRVWPRSASAYASVGLPVNPVGLAFEDVHFQHALQDGHPALVVTGVLRNIRPQAVIVPPLQVELFDKQGRTLLTRTASPGDPELGPGQSRNFTVSLLDPPMFATDLQVDFAAGPAASRPHAEARPVPVAQLRTRPAPQEGVPALPRALMVGPPIPEAKPLPPSSPYALPRARGG
jgi:predicted Zn finger-like uncharacterized protein